LACAGLLDLKEKLDPIVTSNASDGYRRKICPAVLALP
jgi:hypothetical protein